MASKREDADNASSPVAFLACSNGEHMPVAESARDRRAAARFRELVERQHKRLGWTRRQFARSACGVAAALWAINESYGCGNGAGGGGASGFRGGPALPRDGGSSSRDAGKDAGFAVTHEMMEDAAVACAALQPGPDELVIDVQMHPPSPLSPWTDRPLSMDAETFVTTAFVDSSTTIGVLSGIPDTRNLALPNVEANRMLQEIIERLAGPRLLLHANLKPDIGPSELEYMEHVLEQYRPAAWKVYPHVGQWRLDSEEVGLPFVARAQELGVPIIAAHRGIADDSGDYQAPSSPVDLVLAAKANPEVTFLTYHSGWQGNVDENHAFDPDDDNPHGVDRLIKAVRDHRLGQDNARGNVYAELGSTWRNLMTQPQAAAHVLGKLLLHLGEDRVLWGTDSVFTGSPEEQIQALRMFEIPPAMQEQYGYPALTTAVKRKIFGLNAARVYGIDLDAMRCKLGDDFVERLRMARRDDPRAVPVPGEKAYGPRSRREFLAFERWQKHFGLG